MMRDAREVPSTGKVRVTNTDLINSIIKKGPATWLPPELSVIVSAITVYSKTSVTKSGSNGSFWDVSNCIDRL